MRQGLEEFRFEVAQPLSHRSPFLVQLIEGFSIYESSHMLTSVSACVKTILRGDRLSKTQVSPQAPIIPLSTWGWNVKIVLLRRDSDAQAPARLLIRVDGSPDAEAAVTAV